MDDLSHDKVQTLTHGVKSGSSSYSLAITGSILSRAMVWCIGLLKENGGSYIL